MYEEYFGFIEKPFSLTPDPKFLYKSRSHAQAYELLQYAIRRREGFVVVTGDIGTGKTTLCRALLEQTDRKTFTALVLNPFLSEEDLLKLILQDFGVVSREEARQGRLNSVTKQELIEILNDFLLSLLPLQAGALVVIDEAQNLPLKVLEQLRILSNLETDKEKLLQIVLVGQSNLGPLLRSPELRQLDQRVSIRYELQPLTRDEVAEYVAHRLTVAGGCGAIAFTPRALDALHRITEGIPRLINLLCDRALLAAYGARENRVSPEMVRQAAESLGLVAARRSWAVSVQRRSSVTIAASVTLGMLGAGMAGIAGGSYGSDHVRWVVDEVPRAFSLQTAPLGEERPPAAGHESYSILVGSFEKDEGRRLAELTEALEAAGFRSYELAFNLGEMGERRLLYVGGYDSAGAAVADERRLRRMPQFQDAHLVVSTEIAAATIR